VVSKGRPVSLWPGYRGQAALGNSFKKKKHFKNSCFDRLTRSGGTSDPRAEKFETAYYSVLVFGPAQVLTDLENDDE
jgi:hypothetical protein